MPEGGAPEGGAPLCWRRLNMPRRRAAGVPEGGAPLGGGPEGLKVPVGRGGGVPLGGAPVPWGGGGRPVPEGAGGAEPPETWGAGAAWLMAAMAVTRAKIKLERILATE